MLWQIPAVDGFDGGVLPLQRYNQLMGLLIPPQELVPDGRIREQLAEIPPVDLLDLMDARYLITDKLRDLWFEGIYYDRQLGATLGAARPEVAVAVDRPLAATAIHLIGYTRDPQARPAGQITLYPRAGEPVTLPLDGGALGWEGLSEAQAQAAGLTVAFRDVEAGRQEYLLRLPLPHPTTPTALSLSHQPGGDGFTIQAVTLVDGRTESFQPLLPSDRGNFRLVHSGDVKIYERLDGPGRAYFASAVLPAGDEAEALALLQAQGDLRGVAVVEGLAADALPVAPEDGPPGEVRLTHYDDGSVTLVSDGSGGLLVLADAYYPGWRAQINGVQTPVYPVNLLFRGVVVPPGQQEIHFHYQPTQWPLALGMSGAGLLLLLLMALASQYSRPI
jgi:hypothetical protein